MINLLLSLMACKYHPATDVSEKLKEDTFIAVEPAEETEEEITEEEQETVEEETEVVEEEEEEVVESVPLEDFSVTGPYSVSSLLRTTSVTNCSNISFLVYTPVTAVEPPLVVLGHGFARNVDVMTGWAEHFASWGVEVILPTLCHYNIWNGVDHPMNAKNMQELADHHGATEVVYAGHSAGGLAALIAASTDVNALGVLGLDTTDTENTFGVADFLGQTYAANVTSTSFFIRGEPSNCNSNNNGLTLFRMTPVYRIVKVTDADHCDFENPTDFLCEVSCANNQPLFTDEDIKTTITALSTAAIMSLTGLSEDGAKTWTEEGMSDWLQTGIVQDLEIQISQLQ